VLIVCGAQTSFSAREPARCNESIEGSLAKYKRSSLHFDLMSWRNLLSFGDPSGMSKQSHADRTETLSDFRKNQQKEQTPPRHWAQFI
jgi:hypothetical protein